MNTTTQETGGSVIGHLLSSLSALFVLTTICCGLYPLLVWGVAQGLFSHQANGSLITKDGRPTTNVDDAVGSALLGQPFTSAGYFHPRPSAAGTGYDAASSGGSNLGPTSDKLLNGAVADGKLAYDGVRLRTLHYAVENGITFSLHRGGAEVPIKLFQAADGSLNDAALIEAFPHAGAPDGLTADHFSAAIPADAVTASASGLDPHVSPANAAIQARRVADARHVPVDRVTAWVERYTDRPSLHLLGDPGVNVLRLNLALDAECPPAK